MVIIMNINSSTGVKQMFSLKVQVYIYNEENYSKIEQEKKSEKHEIN
jgi:hypothetical protein